MRVLPFPDAYHRVHGIPYVVTPHGVLEDHTSARSVADLPPIERDPHGPRLATYLLVHRDLVPACRDAWRTDCLYEEGSCLYLAVPLVIDRPGDWVGRIAGRDVFAPEEMVPC